MLLLATASTVVTPAGPPADLSWTIAALAVGAVLWATGGWVLRSATAAMGLAIGGLAGWMAWQETGIGPPWAAPAIGAVTVACVALLAYRLLAGGLLAAVLALLCGATAWTVLHLSDPSVIHPPVAALFGLPVADSSDLISALAATGLSGEATEAHLAPFRQAWETLAPDPRLVVFVAAACGALCGLVMSTFAASNAAVLLTAAAGSLMILGAIPRLLIAYDVAPAWIQAADTASGAVLTWIALTAIGMAVQGLARPKLVKPQAGGSST